MYKVVWLLLSLLHYVAEFNKNRKRFKGSVYGVEIVLVFKLYLYYIQSVLFKEAER